MGIGEGYTGVLPSQLESGGPDSGAGPVGPAGAGVGGLDCSARPAPRTHPPGPVACGSLVLGPSPQIAASWPIRARFHHIFYKVSQNGEVSP